MVDVFFSGSTEALLAQLLRSEKLTAEQLLELGQKAAMVETDSAWSAQLADKAMGRRA